jgi:DNA-binding XRE family transcriptional regulator
MPTTIGQRLRQLREERRMTMRSAAKAIGVSYRTWNSWEYDERVPRDEYKKMIADYFGVSVQQIFFAE